MNVAGYFQARDYPEHICPVGLELHGDPRGGWHGAGQGGALTSVCVIGTACGCKVTGNGTLMHPILIEPCADHRGAMYPAVEATASAGSRCSLGCCLYLPS